MPGKAAGLRLETSASDIIEIAALRGRARDLDRIALGHGVQLPPLGRALVATDHLTLCVRPERWLVLTPPASAGASAAVWQAVCAGLGAVLDLSSGLSALELAGPDAREVLVRSCRIDLDPQAFPVGAACATIMAQVPVTLVALASGVLLLTPASTARHFHQWLVSTSRCLGFVPPSHPDDATVSGDEPS
ncbi:MAG TPA: sarcosine oxidase subunit gamma family protein [Steroidobacteraceae bacterium]|jgi:sarcosine oxidase subunit gamma|nr:sarcosine oxidase subunit gamma family protein [Steroidobacteraceae bacterium]